MATGTATQPRTRAFATRAGAPPQTSPYSRLQTVRNVGYVVIIEEWQAIPLWSPLIFNIAVGGFCWPNGALIRGSLLPLIACILCGHLIEYTIACVGLWLAIVSNVGVSHDSLSHAQGHARRTWRG